MAEGLKKANTFIPGKPIRLLVMVSGGGTSLENLYTRIADKRLNAEIALVISSKPSAFALERAKNHNTPTRVLVRKDFLDTAAYSTALKKAFDETRPDLVVCAGWLKHFLVDPAYAGKIINIHPSLIPAFAGQGFYGHHVHEAVLARGCKVTGCTVHFIDNDYDAGPIILQKTVPVEDNDDVDKLQARVLTQEYEALPEAIALIQSGKFQVEGRRVKKI